jgi:hypothetical protein
MMLTRASERPHGLRAGGGIAGLTYAAHPLLWRPVSGGASEIMSSRDIGPELVEVQSTSAPRSSHEGVNVRQCLLIASVGSHTSAPCCSSMTSIQLKDSIATSVLQERDSVILLDAVSHVVLVMLVPPETPDGSSEAHRPNSIPPRPSKHPSRDNPVVLPLIYSFDQRLSSPSWARQSRLVYKLWLSYVLACYTEHETSCNSTSVGGHKCYCNLNVRLLCTIHLVVGVGSMLWMPVEDAIEHSGPAKLANRRGGAH